MAEEAIFTSSGESAATSSGGATATSSEGATATLRDSTDTTTQHTESQEYTPIIVAVSSRALFDVEKEHTMFETGQTYNEYIQMHITQEEGIMKEGFAYPIIQLMHNINLNLKKKGKQTELFKIIMVSRNSAAAGVRLQNALECNELHLQHVTRMCMCNSDIMDHLKAIDADLLITKNSEDASNAFKQGIGAFVVDKKSPIKPETDQLHIAFELDTLLDPEEYDNVHTSPRQGLLVPLAKKLGKILKTFHNDIKTPDQKQNNREHLPISIFVASSRPSSVAARTLKFLRSIELEEIGACFLDGDDSEKYLDKCNSHIILKKLC